MLSGVADHRETSRRSSHAWILLAFLALVVVGGTAAGFPRAALALCLAFLAAAAASVVLARARRRGSRFDAGRHERGADLVEDRRVVDRGRRRVLLAVGDPPHRPAQDLPRPRLREPVDDERR